MPTKNGGQKLKREIAALQRQLANVQVRPKRTRRGRRGGAPQQSGGVPAACVSNPRPVQARSRRGAGARIGNGGRITLTRDELFCSVVTTPAKAETSDTKNVYPSTTTMPFLFRLASCYQRIRWVRASISWRPACGTGTNGIISYGVAFNNTHKIATRDDVTSLTPCNDHPVWQSSGASPLTIPSDMLMSRRWYMLGSGNTDTIDSQPGRFAYGLTHNSSQTAEARGEFWIHYTVEMEGTNPG